MKAERPEMSAKDLEILMSEYNVGLDVLIKEGVAKALGDTVIVRGITKEEIHNGSKGVTDLGAAASASDIRQSVVFEVVSVGSGVPEEVQQGSHCVPISAGLDPVRAEGATAYAVCDYEDLQFAWDPGEAVECLRDNPDSALERKKRANFGE